MDTLGVNGPKETDTLGVNGHIINGHTQGKWTHLGRTLEHVGDKHASATHLGTNTLGLHTPTCWRRTHLGRTLEHVGDKHT